MKCPYRANKPCIMPNRQGIYKECILCVVGQLCDETSLSTRAFMDASIDMTEKEADDIRRQFQE